MQRALFPDLVRDFAEFRDYCRLVEHGKAGIEGRPRFSRIYAGAEFCVNRLPSVGMISAAAGICADCGLDFSLVLPPVFDTSFEKVDRLVSLMTPGTEVVINDWGQIDRVVAAGCVPVMGRALNRLVRDPRIETAGRPEDQIEFLRMSQAHIPMIRDHLKKLGIIRIELDNTRQGIAPAPDRDIPFSIYTPWTLISISRFCGPTYAATCPGRPCFTTKTFVEGIPIIADGTCTFWFNAGMPDDFAGAGIDRIVHVPGPEGLCWLQKELEHRPWDEVELPRLQSRSEVVLTDSLERIVLQALDADFESVCVDRCGFGAHLEILERMGKTITGIDSEDTVLDVAGRRASSTTLIKADSIGRYFAAEPFDLIIALSFGAFDIEDETTGIVRNIRPGGLLLIEAGPERLDGMKPALEPHFSFVWQNERPDGRILMLLAARGAVEGTEKRIGDLIDAFVNKGFDSHDTEFIDLTIWSGRTPGKTDLPAWIKESAARELADLGFRYLWRELEGEGRTMFRLAHADWRIELEFSPIAQNRAAYRTCGAHNVAYHGEPPDMAVVDAAIDILSAGL